MKRYRYREEHLWYWYSAGWAALVIGSILVMKATGWAA